MGLFGFKKQPNKVSSGVVAWLEAADNSYCKALQSGSTSGLEHYFSKSMFRLIAEQIRRNDKMYSGLDRYRHVKWEEHGAGLYIKIVTYDQMQISKGIQAKVGDDYKEEWQLAKTEEGTKVIQIRRCA